MRTEIILEAKIADTFEYRKDWDLGFVTVEDKNWGINGSRVAVVKRCMSQTRSI
ncbi:hypothetical protein [Laceyella putida]|uniref:Uncharacterized protein n=2 Tax=Laceyella putida TaxID=110101 RepID=A0ABW2RQ19_9BACL